MFKLRNNLITRKDVSPLRIVDMMLKSVTGNYKTKNLNLSDCAGGAAHPAEIGKTSSAKDLEILGQNHRKRSNLYQTVDRSNLHYSNPFKKPLMEAAVVHLHDDKYVNTSKEQTSYSLVRSRIDFFENFILKGNRQSMKEKEVRTWYPFVRERIRQFEEDSCGLSTSKETKDFKDKTQFQKESSNRVENEEENVLNRASPPKQVDFNEKNLDFSCQLVKKKDLDFKQNLAKECFTKYRNGHFSKWIPKDGDFSNDFSLVRAFPVGKFKDAVNYSTDEFFSSLMKNLKKNFYVNVFMDNKLKSMKNTRALLVPTASTCTLSKALLAEQLPNLIKFFNEEPFYKKRGKEYLNGQINNFICKLCEVLDIPNYKLLDMDLKDKSISPPNSNCEDAIYQNISDGSRTNDEPSQNTSPTTNGYCYMGEGKINYANVQYLKDEVEHVSVVLEKEDNGKELNQTIKSERVTNIFEESKIVSKSTGNRLKLPQRIEETVKKCDTISKRIYETFHSASVDGIKDADEIICLDTREFLPDASDSHLESLAVQNTFYEQTNADSAEKTQAIEDEIFFELKEKLDRVSISMIQASKALDFCRKDAKYSIGLELIEAERILLMTDLRRDLLKREMQKVKLEEVNLDFPMTTAEITIKDIEVPLTLTDADNSRFFVCIVSFGDQVCATKAVKSNYKENFVCFKDELTLQKVPPEFEINVEVYGTKLKKKSCKKYFYNSCFYKKKIFSKKTLYYRDLQTCTLIEAVVPFSSFTRIGGCKVNLSNLGKNQTWVLDTDRCSVLGKTIRCNVNVENLLLNVEKTGFLNIGIQTNDSISWSPIRCNIEGVGFNFTTCPNENEATKQILKESILKNISACDTSVCARPNTLLMEVEKMDMNDEFQYEIERYFLSAETEKDIKEWHSVINNILVSLNQWQIFY